MNINRKRRWAFLVFLCISSGYLLGDVGTFWFLVIPAFFNVIALDAKSDGLL